MLRFRAPRGTLTLLAADGGETVGEVAVVRTADGDKAAAMVATTAAAALPVSDAVTCVAVGSGSRAAGLLSRRKRKPLCITAQAWPSKHTEREQCEGQEGRASSHSCPPARPMVKVRVFLSCQVSQKRLREVETVFSRPFFGFAMKYSPPSLARLLSRRTGG